MDYFAILAFFVAGVNGGLSTHVDSSSPHYVAPVQLVSQIDLSEVSWFVKKAVRDELIESAREMAGEAKSDSMGTDQATIQKTKYFMYSWRRGCLAGVVVSKKEYPTVRVASLMAEVFKDVTARATESRFDLADVRTDQELIKCEEKNYLNFKDHLTRVGNQLTDIKALLNETVLKALERGEKLNDLVKRSEAINETAGIFRGRARKLNQKCPCLGF